MARFRLTKRIAAFALLLAAVPAWADTFSITITTSAAGFNLQGLQGELLFQLSQGVNSEPVTVTLSNFVLSGGSLGSVDTGMTTPGITGTLPATVSMPNSLGQSVRYAQHLTFGSQIVLDAAFAFTPTPGLNPSAAFEVDLAEPNLTNPSRFVQAAGIDYDSDGAVTTFGDVVNGPTAAPEPDYLAPVAAALGVFALFFRRRMARSRNS
ncbi:MAG: hypothetical protein JOY54_13835 [Acidobacteriaceae bacterium]|nr:hypothetical protein [Acidobacteriaceae bacterium]